MMTTATAGTGETHCHHQHFWAALRLHLRRQALVAATVQVPAGVVVPAGVAVEQALLEARAQHLHLHLLDPAAVVQEVATQATGNWWNSPVHIYKWVDPGSFEGVDVRACVRE